MTSDPVELTLRDGATVMIEPIRPEHKQALERGFERLSDESPGDAVGVARSARRVAAMVPSESS